MRLTIILILFPLFLSAQIWKGAGISYTSTSPTHDPGLRGAWVAIDTLTGQWYERDHISGIWREMGARLQATNTTGIPSYTPSKQRGRFAINAGDSLYYYQAGTWTLLGSTGGGGGDDWGVQVVETDGTLSGSGTVADPLKVDTSIIATVYDLQDVTVDLTGYVEYGDSLTTFITPSQLVDSINAIPPNTDTQDLSIDSTGRIFTISLVDGGSVVFQDTNTEYDLTPYVEYADSLTTFVTPDMLTDTSIAIRADFPVNTDDQAISIDSVGRYFTITLEDGGSITFQDQV
jgi:hypothetical protein